MLEKKPCWSTYILDVCISCNWYIRTLEVIECWDCVEQHVVEAGHQEGAGEGGLDTRAVYCQHRPCKHRRSGDREHFLSDRQHFLSHKEHFLTYREHFRPERSFESNVLIWFVLHLKSCRAHTVFCWSSKTGCDAVEQEEENYEDNL